MSVRLEADAFLLKEFTLLTPTRHSAPDTVDDTMAGIYWRCSTKDVTDKAGMSRCINEVGYLTIAHDLATRN